MAYASSLPARIPEWAGVGTTYYVDQSIGSDSNTQVQAQSEATPWLTIQHAIDNYVLPAAGHVRILVKNGTYKKTGSTSIRDATVKFSGLGVRTPSFAHTLQLLSFPGHTPVINEYGYVGSDQAHTDLTAIWFDDSSARFIRVRGFEVVQSVPSGASTWQAHGISFDSGSADCEIDQCEVHGWVAGNHGVSPQSAGIYTNGGAARIHLYNIDGYDIGTNAGYEGYGGSHPFYLGGAGIVVANCIGRDSVNGYGLQFYQGGGGGSGCFLVNSIFSNSDVKSGATVYGTFNVTVRNCIFYDNYEYGFRADNLATVSAQNCITFANGLAGNLGNGYNVAGASLTLANNIASDPLFVNYATRDFHLQGGSPGVNAGLEAYSPPNDFDGDPYTQPMIGSFAGTATGAPPINMVLPQVTGAPTEGQTLTSGTGAWTGSPTFVYTYQWQRCDSGGGSCVNIGAATSASYTLVTADVGSTIRCRVTATNPDGAASANSAVTAVVGGLSGGGGSPVNTALPTISGSPIVGYTLVASAGTWTGAGPMTYAYQWRRCDSSGANCADIGGATSANYTVVGADTGSCLRIQVTASN